MNRILTFFLLLVACWGKAQTTKSTFIELNNVRVMYKGLPNYFSVAVPGIKKEEIELVANIGQLTYNDTLDQYNWFSPREIKIDHVLTISILKKSTSESLAEYRYRIKDVPKFQACLGSISESGIVNKGVIKSAGFIFIVNPDFTYSDISIRVSSYKVKIIDNYGAETVFEGQDARITDDLQERLLRMVSGEKIFLYEVTAKSDLYSFTETKDLQVTVK